MLHAVEGAILTSSPTAVNSLILRSVREPASSNVRNLGVGASIDNILTRLKTVYGNLTSFDELMRQFLNVLQSPYESVNEFVLRLEKAFAAIRDNYPLELTMVDKTQHLRERFYQGLKREIHQKLAPSYEDGRIPYVVLIKQARELEAEFYPKKEVTIKGNH